jgi:hypothetical protein
MAGGDKSGPDGRGPMSGRGLGYCAGTDRPGYEADAAPAGRGRGLGRRFGRGAGRGYGRGRGFGNGFGPGFGRGYGRGSANSNRSVALGPENEVADRLSDEIARLRDRLKALENRLGNSNQED